ncbi:MAG TPA: SurA N-terminal domain-containing protein [Xanthobacteraceae bacterium]|nr:SurA N-terminal domain-containing protein [Xanthobacteraceae bacterium]
MLRGIHKASANWLGRIVMGVVLGLIAISFGIWGIGDIFRGFGQSTVAKVGRTEISVDQFRQIYNDRLQELGRRAGRPITPEQARLFGLDRQILYQMIRDIVLDERVHQLGLGMPDSEIARRITEEQAFRGFGGQFDRERFLAIIRQLGYTEQRFIAERRRELLRQQLMDAVNGDLTTPKSFVEAFNRYQNEQRTIEYVLLDKSSIGEIPKPAPEVLTKYYEDRKVLFRAPEYRKISLLVLTPAEILPSIEVSDADIKAAYDRQQSRYVVPERRHVQQIMFEHTEDARAAYERLTKGLSFAALAAEPEIKPRYTDLGTVAKSAIIDPVIGNAAFALKNGGLAEPTEGRFGTALIFVDKIVPGQTQPLEKVSTDIKKEIGLERATREVQTMRDKIEDERLDGKSLEQAAQKLGLKLRTIEAVDRSGRGPDGKPIADLPEGADVLTAAFNTDIGGENDALQAQGGGYVWYDVVSITQSRERPYDEVKDQVESRWRDDQITDRLKAKTTELLGKLKSGATFADFAKADKLKVQTASGLKRGTATTGFPLRALNEIFRTAKDSPGVADGEKETDRIVFRVTDISVPAADPNTPESKRLAETVQRSLADDLMGQYLISLQNDIGITINQNALNQVTGASTN